MRIDRIDVAGQTIQNIATFTARERVNGSKVRRHVQRGLYIVRWPTARYTLDPKATYRARVLVGGRELGFADIDLVTTEQEYRKVNTNAFVPLKQGPRSKAT